MICPLCNQSDADQPISGPDSRKYYQCKNCLLIFVNKSHLLLPEAEKIRYDLHKNSLKDKAYVEFLNRAIRQITPYMKPGCRVLDYGCGPVPALIMALREKCICETYLFDPFYFPGNPHKYPKFDIIFTTEVIEHLHNPGRDIPEILSLLRQDGLWCIMTELYPGTENFKDWYYALDPTHVVFYSEKTIHYICDTYQMDIQPSNDNRVFLLRKKFKI